MDSGEAAGGALRSEPGEAGRNTEAERVHADVRDPDVTGPADSADAINKRCADFGPDVQRA